MGLYIEPECNAWNSCSLQVVVVYRHLVEKCYKNCFFLTICERWLTEYCSKTCFETSMNSRSYRRLLQNIADCNNLQAAMRVMQTVG